jgi:hypothetical protein
MLIRLLALATTLGWMVSQSALAIPAGEDSTSRADARVAEIGDAREFVREVNDTLTMAKAGTYGAIAAKDVDRLDAAVATINRLLQGQQRATDLGPDQRIELYNAQEEMVAILRNDEKNRVVCERVTITGSRVGKRECMTVAQREERARAARESTDRQQRVDCVPGETSICGKPVVPFNPGG